MANMTKLTRVKYRQMYVKIIKSEKDYDEALKRLDQLFDAEPGTPDGDELEVLALLIEDYETRHYPIPPPDPIEAIKFSMEQRGLAQKDLAKIIGHKSRASEILSGKRKLTLKMIRNINKELGIATDVLVQEY